MFKAIVRSGLALGLIVAFSVAGPAVAARAQQQAQQKPAYTYAEYNAYQAAAKEKDPQQQVKLLDGFVSKFPKSTLMPYVDQAYYRAYDQLKQYDKVIEYADKLVGSSAKEVTDGMKLQAIYAREVAFNVVFDPKATDATQQAQTARDDATMGLKLLNGLTKPANMSDAQFAEQKKGPAALFNYTAGYSSYVLKDYPAAVTAYRAALAVDPTNQANSVTYFRLGVAYLQQAEQEQAAAPTTPPSTQATPATPATPPAGGAAETGATPGAPAAAQPAPLPGPSAGQPEFIKGFWALARSIALKGANQDQVSAYLKNQMLRYQKTACEDLLTNEMNQLLQMAQTNQSIDPPSGYNLASGVQLSDYLQSSNLFTIMQDLEAGQERAQFVWLAVCGNQFPQVPIKVIAVTPTDTGVDMQVYAGPTSQALEQAKAANMQVQVPNQAAAQRLKKDDIVRFTGTLSSYDPAPTFLLHWTDAQVNPADISPEKPTAAARQKQSAGR